MRGGHRPVKFPLRGIWHANCGGLVVIQIQLQRNDPQLTQEVSANTGRAEAFKPFGDDGLTFGDIIDMLNPLQHIPIIGSLYRKFTGDMIDPAMKVAGGALFGGPIGAAVSLAAVFVGEARKDVALDAGPSNAELADNTAKRENNRVYPVSLAATRHTNRLWLTDNAESISSANSAKPRPDSVPEIRRGGWMVAQAYGPVIVESSEGRRGQLDSKIDLTV